MIHPEIAFIIGHKLGELARYLELVIERSTRDTKEEKIPIRVLYVYETLKYLESDLTRLQLANDVGKDISLYIQHLGNQYGEIRQQMEQNSPPQPRDDQMLVSKIKEKLSIKRVKQEHKLRIEDVKNLEIKLKIWKDRLTIAISSHP